MEHEVTPEEAAKKQLMSVAEEFVEFIVAAAAVPQPPPTATAVIWNASQPIWLKKRLRISVRSTKR